MKKLFGFVSMLFFSKLAFACAVPEVSSAVHNASTGEIKSFLVSHDKDRLWDFLEFELWVNGSPCRFAVPLSGGEFSDGATGSSAYLDPSQMGHMLSVLMTMQATSTPVTVYHNRTWTRSDGLAYNLADRIGVL